MSFINVRSPTGHLDIIPVQINAPLIKAFEAACAKRSLNPKSHKLVHKKKLIDLSISFRHSGLLNHANVELVPCEDNGPGATGSSLDVRVGFRLEDGHRVQWSGSVSFTLWDILLELAANDERVRQMLQLSSEAVPTIIYIQQPIGGEEALRETTLESLGIRGSVLFKLDRRPPPPPSLSTNPKLPPSSYKPASSNLLTPTPSGIPSEDTTATMPAPPPSQPTSYSQMPQGESASLIFSGSAGPSAINEPFSIFGTPPTTSIFGASNEPSGPKYSKPTTMGELLGISLEPDAAPPSATQTTTSPPHLQNFKFPAETAGQNLMEVDDEHDIVDSTETSPCDREDVLFQRITFKTSETDSDELPDEFFQITEGELRLIISSLRKVAGTDAPLGEANIHKAARERLYARFPRCIIKFVWCDDVVLQACFRPQERVSALYDFIRTHLKDTSREFQLFTTPPKILLSNRSDSLVKAQLVPMAKIHMTTASGSPKAREVLRTDVLEGLKTNSAVNANAVASKWMSQRPKS